MNRPILSSSVEDATCDQTDGLNRSDGSASQIFLKQSQAQLVYENQSLIAPRDIPIQEPICTSIQADQGSVANASTAISEQSVRLWPPPGVKWYYSDDHCAIALGDCREVLPTLEPVDLVLTDPPYGITANEWDVALEPHELARLLSGFKTVVMLAGQPFSSLAVCADLKRFRHEWIWQKNRGSNFANTVREPMKEHEHVLVFSDGDWSYSPIAETRSASGLDRIRYSVESYTNSPNYGMTREGRVMRSYERVPSSIQKFNTEVGLHPTQKPIKLFHYLLRTYAENSQAVLDPFMGSGTTLRAAKDLGITAIGIEIEERYCEIAAKRMAQSVLNFTDEVAV